MSRRLHRQKTIYYFVGSVGALPRAIEDIERNEEFPGKYSHVLITLKSVSECALEETRDYFKNNDVRIFNKKLKGSFVHHFLVLCPALTISKYLSLDIFVYHQCGWPVLDLLIWWIKPNVKYTKEIELSNWEIPFNWRLLSAQTTKIRLFNYFLEKTRLFKLACMHGSDNSPHYLIYMDEYPKNTNIKLVTQYPAIPKDLVAKIRKMNGIKQSMCAILLFSDNVLLPVETQAEIANKCEYHFKQAGIPLYLKLHPQMHELLLNSEFKNQLKSSKIINNYPAEFIWRPGDIVLGFDSTFLSRAKTNSISLMKIAGIKTEKIKIVKELFINQPLLPETFDELRKMLSNIKSASEQGPLS